MSYNIVRKSPLPCCVECHVTFGNLSEWRRHRQLVHGIGAKGTPLKCEKCPFYTMDQPILNQHLLSKHGISLPRCLECNTTFETVYYWQKHRDEMHSETKILKCNLCSFTTQSKDELVRHSNTCNMNIRKQERPKVELIRQVNVSTLNIGAQRPKVELIRQVNVSTLNTGTQPPKTYSKVELVRPANVSTINSRTQVHPKTNSNSPKNPKNIPIVIIPKTNTVISCDRCVQTFKTVSECNKHKIEAHRKKSFLCCPNCNFLAKNKRESEQHKLLCDKLRTCKICAIKFLNSATLNQHVKDVHETEPLPNIKQESSVPEEIPLKIANTFTTNSEPMKQQTSATPPTQLDLGASTSSSVQSAQDPAIPVAVDPLRPFFPCEFCDGLFPNVEEWALHQATIHSVSHPPPNMENRCLVCQKFFPDVNSMKKHVKDDHPADAFFCYMCDYSAQKKYSLQRHLSAAHKVVDYPTYSLLPRCWDCSETFTNITKWKKHRDDVHSQEEIFTCEECQFTTHLYYVFAKHSETVHKQAKPGNNEYRCMETGCNKFFSSLLEYKAHEREVHPEYYICHLGCDYKSTVKSEFDRHMQFHGATNSSATSSSSSASTNPNPLLIKCVYCQFTARTANVMTQHVKLLHPGPSIRFGPGSSGTHVFTSTDNNDISVVTETIGDTKINVSPATAAFYNSNNIVRCYKCDFACKPAYMKMHLRSIHPESYVGDNAYSEGLTAFTACTLTGANINISNDTAPIPIPSQNTKTYTATKKNTASVDNSADNYGKRAKLTISDKTGSGNDNSNSFGSTETNSQNTPKIVHVTSLSGLVNFNHNGVPTPSQSNLIANKNVRIAPKLNSNNVTNEFRNNNMAAATSVSVMNGPTPVGLPQPAINNLPPDERSNQSGGGEYESILPDLDFDQENDEDDDNDTNTNDLKSETKCTDFLITKIKTEPGTEIFEPPPTVQIKIEPEELDNFLKKQIKVEVDDNNEDPLARKRRLARERQQRWRQRLSQDKHDAIRKQLAQLNRIKRELETPEQTLARRQADAYQHALRRACETPEQTLARRQLDAHRRAVSRLNETPDDARVRRQIDADKHALRRDRSKCERETSGVVGFNDIVASDIAGNLWDLMREMKDNST